ncbi:ATP-binding cassette domain-containing protein [Nguyenibacter vanlangensis]|nr:ATP-binding cassette domain-containing protein [Nguyenibacter vanlangensis]
MTNPSVAPAVDMRGITRRFGAITPLRGVDLSIGHGEVLGLLGDNGAGKSTLTKILSGALAPSSGEILIDGRPCHFASPRDAQDAGIHMVYQDLSLCGSIDVAGNLFMGREPTRRILGLPFLDTGAMHRRSAEMLQGLGVVIRDTHARVDSLSGGQRQAIAIARAAAFNPRVLILDEPTAALAVMEVEAVLDLITKLRDQGVTVILITHRLQDLFHVCDRVAVIRDGIVAAERRIGDTNIGELVDLIVGERFHARSAH